MAPSNGQRAGEKKAAGDEKGKPKQLAAKPRAFGARDRKVAETKKKMMTSAEYLAASEVQRKKMLEDEKARIRALPEYADPYSNSRTTNTRDNDYRKSGGIVKNKSGKKGKRGGKEDGAGGSGDTLPDTVAAAAAGGDEEVLGSVTAVSGAAAVTAAVGRAVDDGYIWLNVSRAWRLGSA